MDTRILALIVSGVVVLIVIAVLLNMRKRKSAQLKEHFGPEYDRVAQEQGDARHAEAVLSQREKRVEKLSIHPLPGFQREGYLQEWMAVQRRFVDDPSAAVTEADSLVTDVMFARGYPMSDFEQRAADISVNYPTVVHNYRSAREIVLPSRQGTFEHRRPATGLRLLSVTVRRTARFPQTRKDTSLS